MAADRSGDLQQSVGTEPVDQYVIQDGGPYGAATRAALEQPNVANHRSSLGLIGDGHRAHVKHAPAELHVLKYPPRIAIEEVLERLLLESLTHIAPTER